jgi:hypothetical protein
MWSLRYAGLLDGPGRVRVPYNAVAGLMRDGVPAEQIGSPVELGNVDWQQRWRGDRAGVYHCRPRDVSSTAASRYAVAGSRVARHASISAGAVRAKNASRLR